MKKYLSILIAGICLALSCDKNNTEPSTPEPTPTPTTSITATTGDASGITCFDATLDGQVALTGVAAKDCDFGFLYGDKAGLTFSDSKRAYVQSKEYPEGKFSRSITDLQMNRKYYYRTFVYYNSKAYYGTEKNFTTSPKLNLSESPVDMGVSVKWDSKNIGASLPVLAGTYFAWGDVNGQTWDGKKWSGSGFSTSVAFKRDETTGELKPESDAARVILGGDWRMPTKAEQSELINNSITHWVEDFNGSGVSGIVFISKVQGHTDACLFIPAAGCGSGNGFSMNGESAVWSSSSKNESAEVWGYGLMISKTYGTGSLSTGSEHGYPIRAVTAK